MTGGLPTEDEVLGYFESCSNWGRWGNDDEVGTLNFITPERRRRAAGLVRDGRTVSCARLIPTGRVGGGLPLPAAPLHDEQR